MRGQWRNKLKQLNDVLGGLKDSKVKSKQLKETLKFVENSKDKIKKENKLDT